MTPPEPAMPQSAAAPSPFPPIADYAFLSNCHTGALVAPDGAIDWLCVPRFDSPSVFGSLLDRGAGAFRFGPFGINVPTARIYEPGTNTLATTWHTPTGWVIVRDALTIGPRRGEDTVTPHTRPPADEDADHLLVRTALCLDGSVEMELRLRARLRLRERPGRSGRWSARTATPPTPAAPGRRSGCRRGWSSGSRGTRCGRGTPCTRATRSTARFRGPRASSRRMASMTPTPGSPRRRGSGANGWRGRGWSDHRWREPIQRSALAIKGLTYMPTGATVAALTTSLPETPGGERNWDYRYTWIRDSTFTLQALHFLNLDYEANEFMQFIADLELNEDGALQIMYGIDGRRDLTESTRDDLSGYAGASPVRVGNGAFDQRQNDVYGAALDSMLLHTRRSQRLPGRLWPIVESQAKCATDVWRQPDQGIWEARGEPQQYVSSKLMCWVALDRASKLAEIRGDKDLTASWRETAEEIKDDILEHGLKEGVLRQHYETEALDASTLLAARLRLPAARRRASAQERARDRRRADRERVRAALPDRRDR